MGSPTLTGGRRYERSFNVPGVYQLFCYLHPMTMHQELTVRPDDDGGSFPDEGDRGRRHHRRALLGVLEQRERVAEVLVGLRRQADEAVGLRARLA